MHQNPPRITVAVSRKMSDGEYGSYGFDLAITLDVPPDENVGEFYDKTYARLHHKLEEIIEKNA